MKFFLSRPYYRDLSYGNGVKYTSDLYNIAIAKYNEAMDKPIDRRPFHLNCIFECLGSTIVTLNKAHNVVLIGFSFHQLKCVGDIVYTYPIFHTSIRLSKIPPTDLWFVRKRMAIKLGKIHVNYRGEINDTFRL